MVYRLMVYVIDVLRNLIHNGMNIFVNVGQDLLKSMENVLDKAVMLDMMILIHVLLAVILILIIESV